METVELGSNKISQIQVFFGTKNGRLIGLVFYSRKKEIARIGDTTIDDPKYFDGTISFMNNQKAFSSSTMIDLAKDEIWCGISTSSSLDG